MIPSVADRLLPNHAAVRSENAWLYSGELIGLPELTSLYTCALAQTAKVYRLPVSYGEALNFDNSTWLEFANAFTDVIRAPVVDDTFDRYYWASTSGAPAYNTRLRIEYNANPVSSTITTIFGTDVVNYTAHPFEVGDKVNFTTSAADLPAPLVVGTDYFVSTNGYAANAFKLAPTLNDAINSTNTINITDDGTGTHTIHSSEHQAWLLGIPSPAPAPSVIVTGGATPVEARSYVCTYVSAYGEEGPPSDPVTVTGNISGSWDLTLPAPASADLGVDRYLTKVRIYRTVTSSQGVATYFFVAEQNINDLSYSDTLTDTEVSANDQLQSTNWSAPPVDLAGWVMMPNGFLVGWLNNELWFSEPYRPHAWNAANTLAVEYPIVGLGVVNQTLVICTSGLPMTGTGVNPSVFSTSKLANFDPCISRGSILSTTEGVYYGSVAGLIRVIPGKAVNITKDLISKDKWQALTQVTALRCAQLGSAIYAFGTANFGIFEETGFDTDGFEQENTTGALLGLLLDPNNERVALNVLTTTDLTINVLNDPWSGELFLIRDNVVLWLDQIDPEPVLEPYLWRSKIFQMEKKLNLAAMRVYFEVPQNTPAQNPVGDNTLVQELSADQYGLVRVYADGRHVVTRELRTSSELMRLPSGFKADFWQFEIEARVRISSLQAASSVKELERV